MTLGEKGGTKQKTLLFDYDRSINIELEVPTSLDSVKLMEVSKVYG